VENRLYSSIINKGGLTHWVFMFLKRHAYYTKTFATLFDINF